MAYSDKEKEQEESVRFWGTFEPLQLNYQCPICMTRITKNDKCCIETKEYEV